MKKIIIFLLLASFSFAQIQSGSTPKYYEQIPSDDINFISVSNSPEIDRNFDPMVFQFGIEYDVDIPILDEAQVYIEDNIYTFILGVSSENAYGLGFNFSDFFLTDNA